MFNNDFLCINFKSDFKIVLKQEQLDYFEIKQISTESKEKLKASGLWIIFKPGYPNKSFTTSGKIDNSLIIFFSMSFVCDLNTTNLLSAYDTSANSSVKHALAEKYQMDKKDFLAQFGGIDMIQYDLEIRKVMELLKELNK